MNNKLKLQQIEELYRRDYRSRINNFFIPESKQGEFFEKYRRTTVLSEEKDPSFADNAILEAYRGFKESEYKRWSEAIDEINTEIAYERFFLNWERRIAKENYRSNHCVSNAATRYRVDRISELRDKLSAFCSDNREAWEAYHVKKYLSDIRCKENHRMVEVSYVADAKERVINALDNGLPVYIVGHLGGGKTQLAMDAAKDFAISKRIQDNMEELMTGWYESNKNAADEQVLEQFRYYMKLTEEKYRRDVGICDKEILDQIQPLFISGSHDLTYEDMFVEKTLTLKTSFSEGSYLNYFEQIFSYYNKLEEMYKEELDQISHEDQTQLKLLVLKSFSDMVIADNSAFGTEVKKVEREILRAAREGRPVIVDELNTIAMQNLIGLNDLLQRQAGENAYITGVGPVYIRPGFAFIGTGNLSSNMVNYEGTNELNPAFKSRFITVEYNYLPQSVKGALMEQESPEKNELFEVVLSYIADEKGFVHLPDIRKNMDELFKLCQLSKLTQNVFIGKWRDNFLDEEETDQAVGDLELKEAVLSIRNIIHVLDTWNCGEEKDLSKALWDGFISSITNPDDQNYILSQAVRYGFFKKQDGWTIKDRAIGDAGATYSEIRQTPYKYYRGRTETYSDLDIVNILYGKGPEEQELPEGIEAYIVSSENLIDMDTYLEYASRAKKAGRRLEMLKELWKEEKSFPSLEKKLSEINGKLEKIKASGTVEEIFDKEFDDAEAAIWEDLKISEPLFREKLFPSKLHLEALPLKGERKINNMVRYSIYAGKGKILASSISNETRILSVRSGSAEWGEAIRELSGHIIGCFNISEDNWTAVKSNGEVIVFKIADSENGVETVSKFRSKLKKISSSVLLDDNSILNVDERGKLEKLCLTEDGRSLPLGTLPISDGTVFFIKKIGDRVIVVDHRGTVLIYNRDLSIEGEFKLGIERIIAAETVGGNSLFLSGAGGRYIIYDLELKAVAEEGLLEGRAMYAYENQNHILILSYDNNAYLMENNTGSWVLNNKSALVNANITNAAKFDESFIAFGLDGSPSTLFIDQFHCESI